MATNHSNLSLFHETNLDIALMQNMLSELTGEDKWLLSNLSKDELLTKLSYCLECKKENLLNLFTTHNQSELRGKISFAKFWKQVNSGAVEKHKSHLANLPEKVFENIVFQNHFKIQVAKSAELASAQASKVKHTQLSNISNDWSKIIQNTAPTSMVDKIEASRPINDNSLLDGKK